MRWPWQKGEGGEELTTRVPRAASEKAVVCPHCSCTQFAVMRYEAELMYEDGQPVRQVVTRADLACISCNLAYSVRLDGKAPPALKESKTPAGPSGLIMPAMPEPEAAPTKEANGTVEGDIFPDFDPYEALKAMRKGERLVG